MSDCEEFLNDLRAWGGPDFADLIPRVGPLKKVGWERSWDLSCDLSRNLSGAELSVEI